MFTRYLFRSLSAGAVVLTLLTSGCVDANTQDQPCLAGARICNGNVLMLCNPSNGQFEPEQTCNNGRVCLSGACVPASFLDGGPSDSAATDTPQSDDVPSEDTSPTLDVSGPDIPVVPDAGLDVADDAAPDTTSAPETVADIATEETSASDVVTDGVTTEVVGGDSGSGADTQADIEDTSAPLEDAGADGGDTQGPEDTGGPDTPGELPDDTEHDGGTVLPPDTSVPGLLLYANVPQFDLQGDLHSVAWHPSGDFALIGGPDAAFLYYDHATNSISSAGNIANGTTRAIVALDDGSGFLVTGFDANAAGKLWRVSLDDAHTVVVDETIDISFGQPVSLTPHPTDGRVAIMSDSSDSLAYGYVWSPDTGLGSPKGFNASAGVWDAMWAAPSLYGGSDALVTSHGINGADSRTWIFASNTVVPNNFKASFGNAGCAGWRPGGTFGVLCGWSTNKLYVFNGGWTLGTLPVPTGAGPQAVAWKHDGSRALITGRALSTYAVVVELRAGSDLNSDYNDGMLVDQSIQQFDGAPYFGSSNQYLQDVAWRPNTLCDEGLIVGGDNGSSFSPTFGVVIRFWDQDDPVCP